ncbi:portal protein [Variovorax sp. GT1P44]|uniref:portal protein n=1 Tax=Variovorax sp. GT1P44 TaxID=3443742 RepID=UPI003F47C9EE
MADITTRDRILRRVKAMETERSTWFNHWREISEVLLPRSGRFFVTDTNRGERRNDILDDTATGALTILGAGMQSGMTSPARPWVRLETQDDDLMNNANVSRWLDSVTRTILSIFARSNTYRSLHQMYEELGAFGTSACIVLPDFDKVIHHSPLTIGEYCLASNDKNEIDTLSRHFQYTVGQIVKQFVAPTGERREKSGTWDWTTASPQIKNLWDNHEEDTWIPLTQLIEPRLDRDARKLDRKNMPWASVYVEDGGAGNVVLNESGYLRFPVLAPRWQTTGNDIYGSTCPGMRALGGIKQLQFEHKRKLQGIDFQTNPPLQVPTSLKNQDSDFLPGGVTYYDPMGGQAAGVRSAFEVQLDLEHLLLDIQDVRQLIRSAFFADVFLSMDQISGAPITAREVQERHEEKLLMLGPVVERQQNELLAPLVDMTFTYAMEAGILPPPPEELAGQELKLEFVSVLAAAQRATAMAGVDRWIGAAASIAAAKQDPSVWDNVDTDKVIQDAAGYLGISPEQARGADEVAQIREARAQAQQAQAKAQAAEQAANTAKTLSQADMGTDNALTNVVQGFAGAPA